MNRKLVGSIKTVAQKSVGKLYRSVSSRSRQSLSHPSQAGSINRKDTVHAYDSKKRSTSVGQIYKTHQLGAAQLLKREHSPKSFHHQLINYDEVEHKLSNSLQCTINTNGRLKYNYLAQHYDSPSVELQPYNKIRYCQTDVKPKKSILQLAEVNHSNHIESRGTTFSRTIEGQGLKNKNVSKGESGQKTKQKTRESRNNKENLDLPRNREQQKEAKFKRQEGATLFTINHKEQKSMLSDKLHQIIDNYETKNKELNQELKMLQTKEDPPKATRMVNQQTSIPGNKEVDPASKGYSQFFLTSALDSLVHYNLKGVCLSDCDSNLEELWKLLHKQLILDEKVRIIKCLVKEDNLHQISAHMNSNRIKRVDQSLLATHSEEYDPFLIEKLAELFSSNTPNLTTKIAVKWVADNFIKSHEEAEHHWLKYLSSEKIECCVRKMILDKEMNGGRSSDGMNNKFDLRDFTRLLSTLFKANLRNRNVYQIYSKLRGMSYSGRFIQVLEEKAGKGQDLRRFLSR